jgi:hypothetical protein
MEFEQRAIAAMGGRGQEAAFFAMGAPAVTVVCASIVGSHPNSHSATPTLSTTVPGADQARGFRVCPSAKIPLVFNSSLSNGLLMQIFEVA